MDTTRQKLNGKPSFMASLLSVILLVITASRCRAKPFDHWPRTHRWHNSLWYDAPLSSRKSRVVYLYRGVTSPYFGKRLESTPHAWKLRRLTRSLGTEEHTETTSASLSPFCSPAVGAVVGILRGGATSPSPASISDFEVSDLVEVSYEWCANLGAPAALVAGAVVATIYEVMSSGELDVDPKDTKLVQLTKKLTRLLLLSAFALETISVFVTTVTGTMILSRPIEQLVTASVKESGTPLSFLDKNFEFEYLTARISFLQGLLNWLGAIALAHTIPPTPKAKEAEYEDQVEPKPVSIMLSTWYMRKLISSALVTTILVMLSFYNAHLSFYRNYACMLYRWASVTWTRFFWKWPPRPLAFAYIPSFIITFYCFIQTFRFQ